MLKSPLSFKGQMEWIQQGGKAPGEDAPPEASKELHLLAPQPRSYCFPLNYWPKSRQREINYPVDQPRIKELPCLKVPGDSSHPFKYTSWFKKKLRPRTSAWTKCKVALGRSGEAEWGTTQHPPGSFPRHQEFLPSPQWESKGKDLTLPVLSVKPRLL